MHHSFAALLQQPTARRYKQLRAQLLGGDSLPTFSLQLAELERAVSHGDEEQAAHLLAELLPSGLLSLQLHRLGGLISLRRGDRERAELHRFTYDALREAIASTGEGTRRRPLLVTYASDARELLAARGLRIVSQSLVEDRGQRFDVLLGDDEREFWFDVTDLLPATATIVERGKRPSAATAIMPPSRKRAVSRIRR
jgi:hypothetical protein